MKCGQKDGMLDRNSKLGPFGGNSIRAGSHRSRNPNYNAGQPKSTNLLVPDLDFLGINRCWNCSQGGWKCPKLTLAGFSHDISVGTIFWTKNVFFMPHVGLICI